MATRVITEQAQRMIYALIRAGFRRRQFSVFTDDESFQRNGVRVKQWGDAHGYAKVTEKELFADKARAIREEGLDVNIWYADGRLSHVAFAWPPHGRQPRVMVYGEAPKTTPQRFFYSIIAITENCSPRSTQLHGTFLQAAKRAVEWADEKELTGVSENSPVFLGATAGSGTLPEISQYTIRELRKEVEG